MNNDRSNIALIAAMAIATAPTHSLALTLKSGEVIGSDGKVYEGASPEQMENIKARDGKSLGTANGNLYFTRKDTTIFVPLSEIKALPKDQRGAFLKDKIITELKNAAAKTQLIDNFENLKESTEEIQERVNQGKSDALTEIIEQEAAQIAAVQEEISDIQEELEEEEEEEEEGEES